MSAVGALFHPRSIALVGATDKSGWSLNTYNNLLLHRFAGPVYLVNPRAATVHGAEAYESLTAIGLPVDLAYVMVPTKAVLSVLTEGARLGIKNYVILTAGFGEAGPGGVALQTALTELVARENLTVLGPNGNGYINAAGGVTPYGLPIPTPLLTGPVGVVLQSGALASAVLSFAQARNIGISLLTSMGNEATVSVVDVLDYLVDDPATRVIALFLESVRRPDRFAAVARKAQAAGKPIVALKIGSSQLASQTARAHTGALVGDDDVTSAAFRQLGVIRVRSLEDLIITAGLLASSGSLRGPRIGVVTPSGGASEIIADRAEAEGLRLPSYAPETVRRLTEILPDFGQVANPLDITGYVVVDRTLLGRAMEVVADDPGIDVVLLLNELPRVRPPDPAQLLEMFGLTAKRIHSAPKPVVVVSNALTDITEFGREVAAATGFPYVTGGIEHGLTAIGAAVRWSTARPPQPSVPSTPVLRGSPSGLWVEREAATLLADNGIPVVPSTYASNVDTAVTAAESYGYPVVLKAAAEGLGHKSDVGGVRLGLSTVDHVRSAYEEILARTRATGVLVQPQRVGGVELLVGVVRDAAWGLTMAVGLGGIWVEVLRDSSLRLLPVDRAEALAALNELRGVELLRGARGTEPADLEAVADVVARVSDLAVGLGDRLESLEINPLLVRGSTVEALDALVTWR
ncbi:acetate--CoA ligase family protein [Fodinicola acaciae]|uniref:acetate--CoA ligase family protein n=1 Tax=Fodinicola acaciae TaxID=2681555 RepID=UPI0013D7F415|nr:acetate--CoA ligase family protein [Fodinicola acaciae]